LQDSITAIKPACLLKNEEEVQPDADGCENEGQILDKHGSNPEAARHFQNWYRTCVFEGMFKAFSMYSALSLFDVP
jgi:hypothetical protein